jgi:hypothetical protein
MKCSECHKEEYKIVAFEVIKHDEKLDIMLPVCEKCYVKFYKKAV